MSSVENRDVVCIGYIDARSAFGPSIELDGFEVDDFDNGTLLFIDAHVAAQIAEQ